MVTRSMLIEALKLAQMALTDRRSADAKGYTQLAVNAVNDTLSKVKEDEERFNASRLS